MLDSTSTSFLTTYPRKVSGRYLAHNGLTPRAKAQLARDILEGRAEVFAFTAKQAAILCRVSVPLIADTRKSPSDRLVEAWNRCSNDQRVEFAQRIGVGVVFDTAIAPALG
jgi:hypothetical protein